ncbi:MAG: cobalt transport protein CbiN [Candidatus Magnetobacterium sp. LHC-1]|uniref:Cobalt transport protein CbiN n=1 Tax=Candidatus Magnetobacterium casense TaxID=1455061 RepID=A0ABS6S175_9BACT|nr:cobalt transport protein CbiN [Candidatus Magnetobacterium casensis]MBF0609178.1 energy-coupling factor ABC transporter substrate-binding protein [Nitrospirota bacterium]MBV6342566.1 energy-coupling factor ABC transporter substrate-binding protein [Candidatus Magnetobacterium casensis]
MKKNLLMTNIALLLLCIAIVVIPRFIHTNAEFKGTDNLATEAIGVIRADYMPWIQPLWSPSEKAEAMIFALQAAVGMIFILAYFAYKRTMRLKSAKNASRKP